MNTMNIQKKERGRWTEETTARELKTLAVKLGHFPRYSEMRQKSTGLADHVSHSGGVKKFCRLLGYKLRARRYWTEEVVVRELKKLAAGLGHFPNHAEMYRVSKTLSVRVVKFGGIDKFRRLSGYEKLPGERGYWTERTVIKGLKPLINKLGRFPTRLELERAGKANLIGAMRKYGGSCKIAGRLGCPTQNKPPGYWTKKTVMLELKEIIAKLKHFPSSRDLMALKKTALSGRIPKFGGAYKLARFFGCKPVKKPRGYWTEGRIVKELKPLVNKLGRFPTQRELSRAGKKNLNRLISKLGGREKFRRQLGEKARKGRRSL